MGLNISETAAAKRPGIYLVLILASSAVFLFLALRGVDWNDVYATIRQGDWKYIGYAVCMTIVSLFFRGIRWGILLTEKQKIAPWSMFWSVSIGYLGNFALPARAGELLRSVALHRELGISGSYILATALAERLMDAVYITLVGAWLLASQPGLPEWLPVALRSMGALGLISLVLLSMADYSRHITYRLPTVSYLPARWRQKINDMVTQFSMGLKSFRHTGRLGGFLVLTIVIWALDTWGGVQISRALGMPLTYIDVFLFIVALGLASAIPSTPGSIGIFQFVAVTILPGMGLSRGQALTYVLVIQGANLLVVGILGLLGLWRLGFRIRDWEKTTSSSA